MGACALAYLMTATVVLVLHQLLSIVRKHLDADVNPGRRRALNAAGTALMASPCIAIGYGALVQRTDFPVREVDVTVPGLAHDLDGLRGRPLTEIHVIAVLSAPGLSSA